MRHRSWRGEMALQGARLAGARHHRGSLWAINTLAGSSPELPAKPFLSQEPMYVRNGLRDPVPIDIFLTVGEKWEKSVEKREKRKEGNWEEFVAWNMEWFEIETASWILNCGRCMAERQKPWKCCESHLALQADELMYIRINSLKGGYFLRNDFVFLNARFYKVKTLWTNLIRDFCCGMMGGI